MKKIFFYIILVVFLSLGGCQNDFLDRAPRTTFSDATLWSSKADVVSALNGCYYKWESANRIIGDDCFTDNGFAKPDGYESMASGLAVPNSSWIQTFWDYKTIQQCNWFINNVDRTPASALTEDLKNSMKSEARFLRVYRYYKLWVYFGDVPLMKRMITPAESYKIPRTSKAEVAAFMLSELDEIASLLPVSYPKTDNGRITRGAALGLKARIQLIEGDYTGASVTAETLMKAPFTYSLFTSPTDPTKSYEELFRPQNHDNQETLLNYHLLKGFNYRNYEGYPAGLAPKKQGGGSSFVPTQSLVDEYETSSGKTILEDANYNELQPYQNRDPRLEMSIIRPGSLYMGVYFDPYQGLDDYTSPSASQTGYNIRKYIANLNDYKGTAYGDNIHTAGGAVMIIRYAEILLTYAEAKIELGQIDASVYDAINQVRKRAGMPDVDKTVYNDQTKMRELIRRERRVELAFEGLRFIDIRRWKIADQVMNGPVKSILKGSVEPNDGSLTLTAGTARTVSIRIFNTKNYVLPIEQKEIDLNRNLIQNQGY